MDDLTIGLEQKRPFPDTDYKNGNVKAIRGRMLKKLMKYELKALFSGLWIALAILAGTTALTCVLLGVNEVQFLTPRVDPFDVLGIYMLFIMLYIYSLAACVIVPVVMAGSRYYNNFFKDEGYLTFSIPATAEEHIAAKHLSAIIATLVGGVCAFVSTLVVSLVSGSAPIFGEVHIGLQGFSAVTYIIEQILIAVTGLVGVFCVIGAGACFAQKFAKRKSFILRFVLFYVILTVLSSLVSVIGGYEMTLFFASELGLHIGSLLILLLIVGVTLFSLWYERRTLKYKLNLK